MMYAADSGGIFPPELSCLYPRYVSSPETFICPSRQPKIKEPDVLKDFTVCYQYTEGLTTDGDASCLLVYDRPDNHRIGHHRGDRNVCFLDGSVKMVKMKDWAAVWEKHQAGLKRKIKGKVREKKLH